MANLKEEENLSPGQKLFISCKIGDYDNVQKILDEINELNDDERETALEYTDKKGNTPLHALVQAPEVLDDFYEKPTDDKKMCCIRLLDLALLPTDTNQNMETVFDLCPLDFRGILDGHVEKRRKSTFRGGSLVAQGATIKSMKQAVTAVMAVSRLKNLQKKREKAESAADAENLVMEV